MLAQGVVLNDRYVLDERIAAGGMGEVWRGTDVLLRRAVAVKVLLPALVSDEEFITRFRTEARMMAALRHPGIVQIHDYGEDAVVNGRRMDYLVMEYIEGVPLSSRIKEAGKLGLAATMSVVAQVAQALDVAHQAGIVHRDVKPSNLLVQPDGSVVLVDFGVARSANFTGVTATNTVLGSAHYMAPEQAVGQPVSAATDIYALGAVAYCCLTGRPPFAGEDAIQIITQHLHDQPPALPPEIPASVAALVIRALGKQPADRYPSAAAFADAARAVQSAMAIPAPGGVVEPSVATAPNPLAEQATVVPPAAGGNRRRKAVLVSVAGTVVIGLTALIIMSGGSDPDHSPAQPVANSPMETSAPGAAASPRVGADADETAPGEANRPVETSPRSSLSAPASSGVKPTTAGSPKPSTKPTTAAPSNPYTAVEVCGSGYQVIDSAPLTGTDGALRGKVYLLYNASTGYNCTTAFKITSVGTATAVSTYLEVQGRARSTDSGSYAYFAGPVRAGATGSCVKWGGSAAGASYNSPFEHCN